MTEPRGGCLSQHHWRTGAVVQPEGGAGMHRLICSHGKAFALMAMAISTFLIVTSGSHAANGEIPPGGSSWGTSSDRESFQPPPGAPPQQPVGRRPRTPVTPPGGGGPNIRSDREFPPPSSGPVQQPGGHRPRAVEPQKPADRRPSVIGPEFVCLQVKVVWVQTPAM